MKFFFYSKFFKTFREIFKKIKKHSMFGPKLEHFYGVFGKKVILHDGLLWQTEKTLLSDFFISKSSSHFFFKWSFWFFKNFRKKLKSENAPCSDLNWDTIMGSSAKNHTPQRSARTDEQNCHLRFLFPKSSSHTLFKWLFWFFVDFQKKQNPKTPPVLIQIGTLLRDLRPKSHTPRQIARTYK